MNESAKAIDRRPIATRNRKWAQLATAWLAARNVSPNAISIAGMCACIAAALALGLTSGHISAEGAIHPASHSAEGESRIQR